MFSTRKIETESVTTFASLHSIENGGLPRRREKTTPTHAYERLAKMHNLLARKINNKKRFCFQLFKQYILFSDSDVSSSCLSVSKYDPLLFTDQKLHSLLKIMQTQYVGRKIWAFINLKTHHRKQQLKAIARKVDDVVQSFTFFHKQAAFELIRETGEVRARTKPFSSYNTVNIAINNQTRFAQYEPPERSVKFEVNLSKGTAESERDIYSSRRRNISNSYCSSCSCYTSCCCCSSEDSAYNLWERIQYLKRLEQMLDESQLLNK